MTSSRFTGVSLGFVRSLNCEKNAIFVACVNLFE